jgi:hypothetical protein
MDEPLLPRDIKTNRRKINSSTPVGSPTVLNARWWAKKRKYRGLFKPHNRRCK